MAPPSLAHRWLSRLLFFEVRSLVLEGDRMNMVGWEAGDKMMTESFYQKHMETRRVVGKEGLDMIDGDRIILLVSRIRLILWR